MWVRGAAVCLFQDPRQRRLAAWTYQCPPFHLEHPHRRRLSPRRLPEYQYPILRRSRPPPSIYPAIAHPLGSVFRRRRRRLHGGGRGVGGGGRRGARGARQRGVAADLVVARGAAAGVDVGDGHGAAGPGSYW